MFGNSEIENFSKRLAGDDDTLTQMQCSHFIYVNKRILIASLNNLLHSVILPVAKYEKLHLWQCICCVVSKLYPAVWWWWWCGGKYHGCWHGLTVCCCTASPNDCTVFCLSYAAVASASRQIAQVHHNAEDDVDDDDVGGRSHSVHSHQEQSRACNNPLASPHICRRAQKKTVGCVSSRPFHVQSGKWLIGWLAVGGPGPANAATSKAIHYIMATLFNRVQATVANDPVPVIYLATLSATNITSQNCIGKSVHPLAYTLEHAYPQPGLL